MEKHCKTNEIKQVGARPRERTQMEAGDGMGRWRWIQESALQDEEEELLLLQKNEKEENGDEFESSDGGKG
jgi:hypothetical protein